MLTWGIWLSGYAALLLLDWSAQRFFGATGVSSMQVWVATMVIAGCAVGYFLAASAVWPMYRRLMVLAIQIPPAYLAAVLMATVYLCIVQGACPW